MENGVGGKIPGSSSSQAGGVLKESRSGPVATHSLHRKGSCKDIRRAVFILIRANPSAESNSDEAKIIKWAREIFPDFQPTKAGIRLDPKKPIGVGVSAFTMRDHYAGTRFPANRGPAYG